MTPVNNELPSSSEGTPQMRKTLLRFTVYFLLPFGLLFGLYFGLLKYGIPIWVAAPLLPPVLIFAWQKWSSRNSSRRDRTLASHRTTHDEDLHPAIRVWLDSQTRHLGEPESHLTTHEEDLHLSICVWLDSATRGLGELAKTRISKDIGSHYFEAYAAAIEEGLAEKDAALQALKTLGNPKSARRGFRKVYLTKREEAGIQGMHSPVTSAERQMKALSPIMLVCGLLLLGIHAFGFVWLTDGLLVATGLMLVVLGSGIWLAYRWMDRGLARRAQATILLVLGYISFIFLPAMLNITGVPENPLIMTIQMAFIPYCAALFIVPGLRTLIKLPKELSAEEHRFFGRKSG